MKQLFDTSANKNMNRAKRNKKILCRKSRTKLPILLSFIKVEFMRNCILRKSEIMYALYHTKYKKVILFILWKFLFCDFRREMTQEWFNIQCLSIDIIKSRYKYYNGKMCCFFNYIEYSYYKYFKLILLSLYNESIFIFRILRRIKIKILILIFGDLFRICQKTITGEKWSCYR